MFTESALPYLQKLSGGQIVSHSLRIFGIGESAVDQMFRDEMDRMTNPTMAPYAKECDCLLQVTAKADTAAEAEIRNFILQGGFSLFDAPYVPDMVVLSDDPEKGFEAVNSGLYDF